MTFGSAPRKILDLRPYLDGHADPRVDFEEPADADGDSIELLGDSPDETQPDTRPEKLPVTWLWSTLVLPGLGAAGLASALLLLLSPGTGFFPTAASVAAAATVTVCLNYRLIRAGADRSRDLDKLRDHVERRKIGERNNLVQTITALAITLEARDPYTKNHSSHVARLSVRLGRRLGIGRDQLYEIHLAGLLHDIGKIGVPDHILLKPSRLTEEEMNIVQSHVEWSHHILSSVAALRSIAVLARHHHERFDGKGYPDGLSGTEIPIGARVMGVADMFMAMTEDRPYRKGLPISAAVDELHRVSGYQLDPNCVQEFLAMLAEEGIYPEGLAPESKSAAAN